MDTFQFIIAILSTLSWPVALVITARIVRDILNEPPSKTTKPAPPVSKEIVPRDNRIRSTDLAPPTYPPRG